MAQLHSFIPFALVALNFYPLLSLAAPVLPARNVVGLTSTGSLTAEEAVVTDVFTAFYPADDSAPATTSQTVDTVTSWATTTVTEEPTGSTTEAVTATPSASQAPLAQSWTLPATFTDLSPMGIKKLAYGSKNIAVVTGIPASATATSPASASATPASVSPEQLPRPWTNSSSAYRLFYPAGSINPGNKPQGGSDFYAMPGNLPFEGANNVTLEYSIFFPADFEWVQGGKLPGIYGGHEGCSGGNDAASCFSTRLMWRKEGAGELYLYAPKDKQTTELCHAPPQSVCESDYGLSVGRGSFHFAAGAWTHVSQTVRLNTPGKQDGGFELVVNGQRVMRRDDVFYRDVPPTPSNQDPGDEDNQGPGAGGNDPDSGMIMRRVMQSNFNAGYASLPPLLPSEDILGGAVPGHEAPLFAPTAGAFGVPPSATATQTPTRALTTPTRTMTLTATITSTRSSTVPPAPTGNQAQVVSQAAGDGAIGFSGLFFSTFFGGHDQSWASPKDQYTWFKDFGMSINE